MLFDIRRPLIQRALWLDGLVSLAAGLLCLPCAAWLAGELGVPYAAVLGLGAFMAAYGAGLLAWAPRVRQPGPGLAWLVAGNGMWVLASVALAFSDWIAPSAIGLGLLLGQAAIVLGITELQWLGLRRGLRARVA
ncbi:hypothetical protein [Pseudomarimonas salicorniae]|uniref:SPW repeat-containing protein n=1 Tax=Pseudomarimonas salicorniae TaxID=2933270 RepID=A0ABT0GIY7_9GAMM|nr:hypothetical protein [Lysobacter sp. CAU 1642]MCK7594501.1 hypothetical protein [Lysobacter sp. CAU 1642]